MSLPPDMTVVERESLRKNGHFWRGSQYYGRVKIEADGSFSSAAEGNRCADVLTKALELTGGDRAKQHGDKRQNHQNIADLWNAYLGVRPATWSTERDGAGALARRLTAADVAVLMCLLKIARMKSGTFNLDNFIDLAGYSGVAAECSDDGQ